ncbi:MAG: hypothetical protein ACYCZD_07605 [Rhodanobacter sp.]
MKFSPKIIAATVALGLSLAAGSVCAQEAMPAHASSSMGGMGHMDSAMKHDKMMHSEMMHSEMMHSKMNGSMHMMPATVTSVDTKTGMVEATSEGMSLRVHFPPKSVEHLKAGDKITLHMGYSK